MTRIDGNDEVAGGITHLGQLGARHRSRVAGRLLKVVRDNAVGAAGGNGGYEAASAKEARLGDRGVALLGLFE